jgi:[ribosomal protein S5]-alanine N-acetyltransferase
MPLLVGPAHSTGALRDLGQPRLDVDENLTLRPWRDSDAATVRVAFECPDIQRWHVRRMDTHDEALAWIMNWAAGWDDESEASWAIVGRDDQPIGQVGLRCISLFEGSAQLSYWVLPSARGTGVAARAAGTLTRWTFDTVRLHRIGLQHSTANQASCRVAAKLGFALEGIARSSLIHADGWHDMNNHARLCTDNTAA